MAEGSISESEVDPNEHLPRAAAAQRRADKSRARAASEAEPAVDNNSDIYMPSEGAPHSDGDEDMAEIFLQEAWSTFSHIANSNYNDFAAYKQVQAAQKAQVDENAKLREDVAGLKGEVTTLTLELVESRHHFDALCKDVSSFTSQFHKEFRQ